MASLLTALRNPVIRQPRWWVIDAQGQRVGRLATQIATLLQGKHKPIYAPSVDCGDFVVVVNSSEVVFTGKKWDKKLVRWHTRYPGSLKEIPAKSYHKDYPDRILRRAVLGMLPPNRLKYDREKRLKIFPGPDHEHHAQKPVPYALHRTVPEDLQAPWGLVPEWRVTFKKQGEGEEAQWMMETKEPIITKSVKKELKRLKKEGLIGRASSKQPNPEGLIRGGILRPGVTKY